MIDSEKKCDSVCPICLSTKNIAFFYPPTNFNEKIFHYKECLACGSSFVDPLPDKSDFDSMYGENDHAYLKELGEDEMYSHKLGHSLYDHQGYQMDFFKKGEYWKKTRTLLDVGCGSGFYMQNAKKFGMEVTGIEYDDEFTKLLRKKTGLDIMTFDDFEKHCSEKKFDLIHFGHILEHLNQPYQMIEWAKAFAHEKTVLIIDGPIEKNLSFTRFVISIGSRIKRNKMNYYPPQHITFTDAESQLKFFERNNLITLRFRTAQQMWPFPAHPDFSSFRRTILFLLGRLSVIISKLNPGWGNVFHYAGKFKV